MKSIHQWIYEFSLDRKSKRNKWIQVLFIPLGWVGLLMLLWSLPFLIRKTMLFNWAVVFVAAISIFYFSRSFLMGLAISLGGLLIIYLIHLSGSLITIEMLAIIGISLFLISQMMQFVGYLLERRKVSLKRHLRYFIIGPAWILMYMFRFLKLAY